MTLINQLEDYRRDNVEVVGSRLAAAEIEETVTLRPTEDGRVALLTMKANGQTAQCVLPRELFNQAQQMHELREALDAYVATLCPSLFKDSI